jgi:PAS domain S-box-containing protein
VNQRFTEITGFSEEELKIKTLMDLNHDEDRANSRKLYQELKAGPESNWRVEKRYVRKNGAICWVICNGTILRDSAGRVTRTLVTFFDITELKQAEQELKEAVRSRDDFLAIASHELRTPLTSLHLQIQLRQRELKRNFPEAFTPARIAADLSKQFAYVRRIVRLVDDILDVSRISEGRLQLLREEFDLCDMVSEVLRRFKATSDAAEVEVRLDACDLVHGSWDRFRLEQVLLNLLNNALKYGRRKPIHVRVYYQSPHAFFSVRDEGIGIRAEDRRRIFLRFERAISEDEVSGLGLGLYISQEIVAAHGGTIEVGGGPGAGSEFVVSLPVEAPR